MPSSSSCVIGFGTNDRWVSWLIRKISKGQYSHTWIEVDCDGLGNMVLHASSVKIGMRTVYGVALVPDFVVRRQYPRRKRYLVNYDLTPGLTWARSMVGAGYDFGVIWNGFLLVLLLLTKWKWLERHVVRNAARPSCSELISSIVKMSKMPKSDILDPELTTSSGANPICVSMENWCIRSELCEELYDE